MAPPQKGSRQEEAWEEDRDHQEEEAAQAEDQEETPLQEAEDKAREEETPTPNHWDPFPWSSMATAPEQTNSLKP